MQFSESADVSDTSMEFLNWSILEGEQLFSSSSEKFVFDQAVYIKKV